MCYNADKREDDFMRKWLLILLCLLPLSALADLPVLDEGPHGKTVAEHASDTLWWRIEDMKVEGVRCFLTRICMADPGSQIGKASSDWQKNIMRARDIADREPEASLIINGSGYVTKSYPWIPENYPGKSQDYWNTPLGSVTVTDGEVLRCLEGVPYYGLTLNQDGLRIHVGDDPQAVLADAPAQTWSFYQECPIIVDGQSILDPEWKFTRLHQMRNIICKLDENNYLNLMVTNRGGSGLTMAQCVDYLLAEFAPEWAYNLDGGPSAGLMYRNEKGNLVVVWSPGQRILDVMTFGEAPAEGE